MKYSVSHYLSLPILITFFIGISTQSTEAQSSSKFFQEADSFFEKYVSYGNVNYQAIKSNSTELTNLVKQLERIAPNEKEEKAFWINAYNILIIKGVIDHYPIKSVMDIPHFFDEKKYKVSGKTVSLNQLEKEMLYKKYPDPRLHFVLVCAAKSCPQLASTGFTPQNLEHQLNTRTKIALNKPKFTRINREKKTVGLSKIFEWYSSDFGGAKNHVKFINKYLDGKITPDYKVRYYEYDWGLNNN